MPTSLSAKKEMLLLSICFVWVDSLKIATGFWDTNNKVNNIYIYILIITIYII